MIYIRITGQYLVIFKSEKWLNTRTTIVHFQGTICVGSFSSRKRKIFPLQLDKRYGYILFLSKGKIKVILLKIIEADSFMKPWYLY